MFIVRAWDAYGGKLSWPGWKQTLSLLLLAACWAINVSPAGLCVSFLIVALVPFREARPSRVAETCAPVVSRLPRSA